MNLSSHAYGSMQSLQKTKPHLQQKHEVEETNTNLSCRKFNNAFEILLNIRFIPRYRVLSFAAINLQAPPFAFGISIIIASALLNTIKKFNHSNNSFQNFPISTLISGNVCEKENGGRCCYLIWSFKCTRYSIVRFRRLFVVNS